MRFRLALIIIVAFGLGWLASLTSSAQTPLLERAAETVSIFNPPTDVPSPSNTLKDGQVRVLSDRVEIDIAGAVYATFTDTNSMDPVLDADTTALELPITDESQVNVGDIASYETPLAPGVTIIHRVVEKGVDADGTYFIFKGDNNPTTDPGKVRPSQLRRKVIGLLY